MSAFLRFCFALLPVCAVMGYGEDRERIPSKRQRTPLDTYRLRVRYIQEGNADALYDLYDSVTHKFFERTGGASGLSGREAFRQSFFPNVYRGYANRRFPSRPRIDVKRDRAVVYASISSGPLGSFSHNIHMVREEGVWKLEMPGGFRNFMAGFEGVQKQIDEAGKRISKKRAEILKSIQDSRNRRKPKFPDAVKWIPPQGLLLHNDWKIHYRSSESKYYGYLAKHAIDGNPRTLWQSQTRPLRSRKRYPHVLVIDLGKERTVRGFRYLTRQDLSWNGTLKKCQFFVSNTPGKFDNPVVTATFKKTKESQEVTCPAVKGRYVCIRMISEINRGRSAAIAELGVIGE